MSNESLLRRIAAGRTDLLIELLRDDASTVSAELLQWAAYYGDVSAVRLLLERGLRIEQLGVDHGLLAAAFHGHWQLVQFLLERGAPVQHADALTGETALHAATLQEDRERYDLVVEILLASGARADARTVPGIVTGSLMRDARTRGETPLHRAAAFGGVRTLNLLIAAGGDLHGRDAQGDSPLAWASWYRRPPEILRLLLVPPHQISASYQPMRVSLLGKPVAGDEP